MIHISSDDVTTGTAYNGTWTLSQPVIGTVQLDAAYFDDGDLPWSYTGVNTVYAYETATPAVVFAVQWPVSGALVPTETAYTTAITAAWNAALPSGTCLGVNIVAGQWEVAFDVSVTALYSHMDTTLHYMTGPQADAAGTDLYFTIQPWLEKPRPFLLELDIAESVSVASASALTGGHLYIPLQDNQVKQDLVLEGVHSSLQLTWSHTWARGVPVPFTQRWDLLFS